MQKWLALITLAPLVGAIINGFLGKRLGERLVGLIACGAVAVSTVIAFFVFFTKLLPLPAGQRQYTEHLFTWISVGTFHADFAYLLDPLSGIYILFITGVGLLIHIYATGYMHGDPGYYRFFAYLNLFMFMMLTLILADNLLLLFVGWEGVGLCSYLLIGYYVRKKEAGDAAKKAFIVNRIGDFGYMIGLFLVYTVFGTISFVAKGDVAGLMAQVAERPVEAFGLAAIWGGVLTPIALLFFVGATGKSAQIPLFVWLPDAMAGPTPVSALIHAATMVTAGVYLVVRCSSIFIKAPTALFVVAFIGAATAILAATIGIAQNDIKKVLAYSTVSQLGYMFLACGVGAFTAAIFHVMTHAFFKALLFLGSGSVIHGMHDEQDMRRMGGLKKYMPITHITMLIGWLAISGFPLLSGFFSKDEILWRTWATEALPPGWGRVLWGVAALTALITAVYMTRLMVMTFWSNERYGHGDGHHDAHDAHAGHGAHHGKPHESPAVMWVPLAVLAVLSVIGGYVGVPPALSSMVGIHSENHFEHFLEPAIGTTAVVARAPQTQTEAAPATEGHQTAAAETHAAAEGHDSGHEAMERLFTGISVIVALLGIGIGYLIFMKTPVQPMPSFLENKYYVDEIYGATVVKPLVSTSRSFLWKIIDVQVIDGIVNGTARALGAMAGVLRQSQTGYARGYAAAILLGAIVVIGFFALR